MFAFIKRKNKRISHIFHAPMIARPVGQRMSMGKNNQRSRQIQPTGLVCVSDRSALNFAARRFPTLVKVAPP
jgi:hypothetical protein